MLDILKTTDKPILHLGGDHDIIFPVENCTSIRAPRPSTSQASCARPARASRGRLAPFAAPGVGRRALQPPEQARQ
ncbi:conserved hypothetical protein, partial [Ricinus communis]